MQFINHQSLSLLILLHDNLILSAKLSKEYLVDSWNSFQLPEVVEVPVELPVLVDQEGSLGPHSWQALGTKGKPL